MAMVNKMIANYLGMAFTSCSMKCCLPKHVPALQDEVQLVLFNQLFDHIMIAPVTIYSHSTFIRTALRNALINAAYLVNILSITVQLKILMKKFSFQWKLL